MLRHFARLYHRTVCVYAGHAGSWTYGVACGFKRPVCERCGTVL